MDFDSYQQKKSCSLRPKPGIAIDISIWYIFSLIYSLMQSHNHIKYDLHDFYDTSHSQQIFIKIMLRSTTLV
jgi:hypothetical protein